MLDRVILFDANETFLEDLNPETFDPMEIDGLDGESRLVFSYPLLETDAAKIKEGCLIAIPDHERVDEWKLYEVVNLKSDDVMVYAECNHDYYNLSTDPITSVTTNADNSDIAMLQALQGTRYQVGTVQINRSLKRSFLRKNPLKLLRLIEREWGGELYFRITITGANKINRYVDHLTRIGSWDGGRFEFGHNLESFTHEVDFTQILTAMYGWGKGETIAEGEADPLTFDDLEWKVANGNPVDKPKGQNWVGDPNALALYGKANGSGGKRHRFGEYESQAETLDGLLWETWAQLQKVNKPLVNIEAKVVDLGAFNPMFSHERARLGDDHLVIASVQSKPIEVKTRIIRFVRYRKNPLKNEVELGNFLPTASAGQSNFEERLSSIERKTGVYDDAATRPEIDPNSPIDASRVQGIIDGVKAQYHNSTGFVYQVPEGLLTLDKAIDNNPTKAMLISGGKFFLANSKNISGEWEWRTYGDGNGFVADEIVAGKLNTDLIEIFGDAYFRWNKQNLYVTDPNDAKKQIRIGKYDGTKYGIAFTKDGGVTWDVALNHEGLRVGSTTVFESGYDPKKVAEEAKAYSDSQKSQIDGQISDVSQEVKDLNTYVDDVFKYDVIEAGEAEALKTQLKQLANLKGNIDNQYTTLNGNADLVAGTPKTNLQTAKTNVDTAYTNLINSINTAVLDNQTTVEEKNDVLAKYDVLNTNTKIFVQRCEEAVNDIARKKAADAQKNATDAAKSYSDGLKLTIDSSIQAVQKSVTDLNTYVDGSFEDGVIAQSEAIAIGKYINSLTATKKEIDLRYTEVYGNANLLGTPKTDLAAKNTTFGTTHNALINSINNAIADGKTTAAEKTDVDTKFATYQTDLSNLLKAFDTAAAAIGQQMANSSLASAKTYADGLKTTIDLSIGNVSKSVTDLNTYVDGAFEDGVIEQAEAKAIEKYINTINADKSELDSKYNDIYANGNLTGTPKTDLATKKTAYNTAHTNLTTSINTAIADGKTTVAEKTDVDTKFTAYRTAVSDLIKAFEVAINAIASKLASNAQTAAQTYADGLKTTIDLSIGNVSKSVTDLNTYVDGSFKDGVIQQAEAKSIAQYINTLTATKKELDLRYTEIYNNTSLAGTPKTDLAAKNTTFGTSHSALINSINTAIADGKTTAAEKTDVDTKFATYQTDLSNLTKAFDTATASIAQKMANDALTSSKSYTDGIKTAIDLSIGNVSKSVTDLNTYVDGAFKDGVIQSAESEAIEKYINLINSDKAALDSRYNDVFANINLTGTPKTDLTAKKTAYNTAHTNLTNSINTAIADGKATAAEATDVNTKFTAYRTAITDLTKAFEVAINAIAVKLSSDAQTAAKSYADGLKTATDLSIGNVSKSVTDLNTYVDGSFKDGVIQQAEAIAIGKYINTLNANKMDYDKAYSEVYNNASLPAGTEKTDLAAKKTAFDTAHTNLINSINTAIADGKTTATEKTDVDTKFTAYNTAISNLRTSIEKAAAAIEKSLVDGITITSRNYFKDSALTLGKYWTLSTGVVLDKTLADGVYSARSNQTGLATNSYRGITETIKLSDVDLQIGDTISGAIEVKQDVLGDGYGVEIICEKDDGTRTLTKAAVKPTMTTGQWTRVVVEGVVIPDLTTRFRLYAWVAKNGDYSFRKPVLNKGNKAMEYMPAVSDATEALGNLEDYINTDFHDDIISKAEADNVEKLLYELDARKNDTEQNYQRTYTNGFLKTTTIKTALSTAKTNFDSAYTALRTSITNSFVDGKLTAAEKTDINAKYATFQTRVTEMSTAYNNALDDIMKGRQDQAAADSKTYADTNFQRSFYQQADPPSAPKIGDIWVETDVFPNVWWAFRGQGWVKSIVNDLSAMVGKIGSTQITDGAVLTPAIGANQVVASHIKSGSISTQHLDVTALNFVDNFSRTNDITSHWSTITNNGSPASAMMVNMPAGSGFPTTLRALALTTNKDYQIGTDLIPVSPNQDYKTRLSYFKPQGTGTVYYGVYAYDKDGVMISIESFPLASRGFTGGTTNEYFMSSTNAGTYHIEAYIAASYRKEDEMPTGRGVTAHLRMKPETAYIKLRILNFYNNGTASSIYFANPTFQLADSGKLSFDNFQGGTGTLGGVNNGNGKLIMQDGSGNLKGQWDNNGMLLKGGSLTIERPDGVQWMANGMQKFNFAVNPHEPMFIGTGVKTDGSWWWTSTGINRDTQSCNFYTYQRSGRYLKLELCYFTQTAGSDNAVVVIDRSGTQILIQEAFSHSNASYSKIFTIDLGTPDYGIGAIYLCLYSWSNAYAYMRNIRMWIEG